jgi:hypothetical protein
MFDPGYKPLFRTGVTNNTELILLGSREELPRNFLLYLIGTIGVGVHL